jgi:hypothetical protein
MNRFDDELKIALRREEPSPDFTNRVMARIAQEKEGLESVEPGRRGESQLGWLQKLGAIFTPPPMKWAMAGAMAALLIASVAGVNRYRQHQIDAQRQAEIAAEAEGQRAKEQVMFAMRIASAKLNLAQKKVQESSER